MSSELICVIFLFKIVFIKENNALYLPKIDHPTLK
jgi:hypothetical protein